MERDTFIMQLFFDSAGQNAVGAIMFHRALTLRCCHLLFPANLPEFLSRLNAS